MWAISLPAHLNPVKKHLILGLLLACGLCMLKISTGSTKDRKAVACIIPTLVHHSSYRSEAETFQQIQVHLGGQKLNVNNARKQSEKNQKAVSCGVCLGASHAKCADVRNVLANMAWTCSVCLLSVLPFHKCCTDALLKDREVITSYEFTENTEKIVRVLKEQ